MIPLAIRSYGIAGIAEGLPGYIQWSGQPSIRTAVGGAKAVNEALKTYYSPLKLRRLDAYLQTALLAAKLALEAYGEPPIDLGLIVCTGYGPMPATNVFMDSFLDFGPQGASPTAFSQTVHNVAASTISMFLDFQGPVLSVSQPGLACSSALVTAQSWIGQGLVKTVLFGAVDDAQPFLRLLFPQCKQSKITYDPIATFVVLTKRHATQGLLELVEVGFPSPTSNTKPPPTHACSTPAWIVTQLLSALDPSQGGRKISIKETWNGLTAAICVRATASGDRS